MEDRLVLLLLIIALVFSFWMLFFWFPDYAAHNLAAPIPSDMRLDGR